MSTTRTEDLFQIQLGLLIEAGGNVQTAVGKVLRWGLGCRDAVSRESNRDCLLRDLDDLKMSIRRIETALKPTSAPLSGSNPKADQRLEQLAQRTEGAVQAALTAAAIELGPSEAKASSGR